MSEHARATRERIHLVATVQGLASERAVVREAFEVVRPAALAIGLSPEAVALLARYQPDPEQDPFDGLTADELVFSDRLSRFGEVDLPAPDLLEAIALANAAGAPVYGVDLTEEAYDELYTTTVNAWQFLRFGHLQRGLAKRPPDEPDARSFSLAWDARRRRNKAVAKVEAKREEHIARAAWALSASAGGPVLLVVDLPREAGVAAWLDRLAAPAGGKA